MKKTLSIFSLLAMLSSVVFAGGIEDPKASSTMAMMKKDNKHVQVFYKGDKATNVQISIYDSENKRKFSEVVKNSEGFSRPYDLSKLKAGEYRIEMNDGINTIVETVNTQASAPTFLLQVIKLQHEANKYVVMASHKNASSLTIRIEDTAHNLLLEHNDTMHEQYAKVFTLSENLQHCTFIVTNNKGEELTIRK